MAVLVRLRSAEVVFAGLTTTVTVALAPLASVPRLQLMLAVVTLSGNGPAGCEQAPWLGVTLCTPPVARRLATVSVTTTLVAGSGPALRTVMT